MLKKFLFASAGAIVLFALLGNAAYSWLWNNTPGPEDFEKIRVPQASVILAADGTQLASISRARQNEIPLDKVSPYVTQALIATEDHRFYEHHGVDIFRTVSAAIHTANGEDQGGSTITQQLVRNIFPEKIGRSRKLIRKLKEMVTAVKLEQVYDKRQILELYLNTVPFLYNVYGIEMAAHTYFNKSASDLNIVESATLVGMLKGSSHYNPVLNPERALSRRNLVLNRMMTHGRISAADYAALSKEPLGAALYRQNEPPNPAPHFVAYVRKWLNDWAAKQGLDPQTDGLVVETSLDLDMQALATRAVEREAAKLQKIADAEWGAPHVARNRDADAPAQTRKAFGYFWNSQPELVDTFIRETPEYKQEFARVKNDATALAKLRADANFMQRLRVAKTRLEASFVAIDPNTGEIKAWVGSRDFDQDQFDHVAQAARQPGSTFKPFVYGAALERGINPDRMYSGGPVNIRLADGTHWRPTDMGGFSGPMSLRDGLVYSKNAITARVMQDVGIEDVVHLAQAMGIRQSKLDPVMSLALGTSPVTLLELASAYTTIASIGDYRPPIAVKRILDRYGRVIADFSRMPSQNVLSMTSALELIDMMRAAVNRGTGQAIRKRFGIAADVAGKTGTTQNNTDGWFMMMHPNLVAGAWVGFNDQRVTMRSTYWGQGGHNAILLVGDFFKEALKTGQIDAHARFPRPWRMPLMVDNGYQSQEAANDSGAAADQSDQAAPATPIVVRQVAGKTYVGDPQSVDAMIDEDRRAARSVGTSADAGAAGGEEDTPAQEAR